VVCGELCGERDETCGNADKPCGNRGKCNDLLQYFPWKSTDLPVENAEIHCGARDVKIYTQEARRSIGVVRSRAHSYVFSRRVARPSLVM